MSNYYRGRALGKLSGDTAIVKTSGVAGTRMEGVGATPDAPAVDDTWYNKAYNASVNYFRDKEPGTDGVQSPFMDHLSYLGGLGTSAYEETGTALKNYYNLLTADTTEENKTNQMLARVGTGVGLLGLGTGLYGAFSKSPEEKAEEQIQSHLTPQEQELRALGYGPPFVPNITPDMLEKQADDFTSIDLDDYKARNRYRKFLDSENALSGVSGTLAGGLLGAYGAWRANLGIDALNQSNRAHRSGMPDIERLSPTLVGLLGAASLGATDYGLSKYDNWDQKKTFGISDYDKLDELLAEEARLERMLKTSSEKTAFIDGVPMPIGATDIATPFMRVNLRDPASRARYADTLDRERLFATAAFGLLGAAGGGLGGYVGVGGTDGGVGKGILGALVGGGLGAGAGYGMRSFTNSRERELHDMDETQQRDQEALRQEQQEIAEEEVAAKQRIERLREALKKKL